MGNVSCKVRCVCLCKSYWRNDVNRILLFHFLFHLKPIRCVEQNWFSIPNRNVNDIFISSFSVLDLEVGILSSLELFIIHFFRSTEFRWTCVVVSTWFWKMLKLTLMLRGFKCKCICFSFFILSYTTTPLTQHLAMLRKRDKNQIQKNDFKWIETVCHNNNSHKYAISEHWTRTWAWACNNRRVCVLMRRTNTKKNRNTTKMCV